MWVQTNIKYRKDNKGCDDSFLCIWRVSILWHLPEIQVTWVRWGVRQGIGSQEKGTDAADAEALAALLLWRSRMGRVELRQGADPEDKAKS